MTLSLNADFAAHFARAALRHVTREYPHRADHVMASDADAYVPRIVRPIFYGSFDWHSCVHGYWTLARICGLYPELPEAAATDARSRLKQAADQHLGAAIGHVGVDYMGAIGWRVSRCWRLAEALRI